MVAVEEEPVPVVEPDVPPTLNCSRSCCNAAKADCALDKISRLQRRRKRIQRLRNLAPLLPAATSVIMVVMMHRARPLLLLLKILLNRCVILLRARNVAVLQILSQRRERLRDRVPHH